jgi:hypothetical protein
MYGRRSLFTHTVVDDCSLRIIDPYAIASGDVMDCIHENRNIIHSVNEYRAEMEMKFTHRLLNLNRFPIQPSAAQRALLPVAASI